MRCGLHTSTADLSNPQIRAPNLDFLAILLVTLWLVVTVQAGSSSTLLERGSSSKLDRILPLSLPTDAPASQQPLH